jgi:hypothetical protein
MDCLRSFTLNLNQNFSFSTPEFLNWSVSPTQHPWTVQNGIGSTIPALTDFNIQGFKNIDLYGISMVGNVYPTLATASRQGLVNDWGIDLKLRGNFPLIGGVFGSNNFGFYLGGDLISLSKFQNEYKLSDPVKSVTEIQIINLSAQGIQSESSAGIDLTYDLTLICYYKFEGE